MLHRVCQSCGPVRGVKAPRYHPGQTVTVQYSAHAGQTLIPDYQHHQLQVYDLCHHVLRHMVHTSLNQGVPHPAAPCVTWCHPL